MRRESLVSVGSVLLQTRRPAGSFGCGRIAANPANTVAATETHFIRPVLIISPSVHFSQAEGMPPNAPIFGPPFPFQEPAGGNPWPMFLIPCENNQTGDSFPTLSRTSFLLYRISAGLHLYLTLAVQFLLYLAFPVVHCGTTNAWNTHHHSPFLKAPCF
jgi:hypothetical protein